MRSTFTAAFLVVIVGAVTVLIRAAWHLPQVTTSELRASQASGAFVDVVHAAIAVLLFAFRTFILFLTCALRASRKGTKGTDEEIPSLCLTYEKCERRVLEVMA